MNWCFDNSGTIVQFNKKAVDYLEFCKNYQTCSLIYKKYDKNEFGSVYYIDFSHMVMYNERYKTKFSIINGIITDNSISGRKIDKILDDDQFLPFCNHTQFYSKRYKDIRYPNIRKLVIPYYYCSHDRCHLRTCGTHNHSLKFWNNEPHDYKKINDLISKDESNLLYLVK